MWAQTTLYYRTLTGIESDPTDAKEKAWAVTDKDGESAESWSGDISNITISESGLELRVDGATSKAITKSVSTTANTKLIYDFVWGYPYNNTYSQDGAYTKITIGNNIEFINEKSNGSSYVINGTKTKYANTLNDTKVAIHLEVNTGTMMVSNLMITKVSDSSVLLSKTSIPLNEGTVFSSLSIGVKHTTNKTDGTRYTRTIFESIKVTETPQFAYSVHWKSGDTDMGEFTSGYDVNGASFTIPYNRYLSTNHELYKISTGNGNDVPTVSFTKTADDQTEYMTGYTKQDAGYVVFCEEAENIIGMTASNSQSAANRASGRKIAYCSEDVTITTLPAGTYTITVGFHGNNNNSGSPTFLIKAGETTILSVSDVASSTRSERSSESFTISETTAIKVSGGTYRCGFDNFYIICNSVKASVTSAQFATFANSTYPLNFDGVVDAYTVTVDGGKLVYTKIDEAVVAGTPVLLHDASATTTKNYNVPVASVASATSPYNALIVCDGNALDWVTYDYYGLKSLTSGKVGFAILGGSYTPSAGKVVLRVAKGTLAREFSIGFDDSETTGISTVNNKTMQTRYFDLKGVEVKAPKAGIYVKNGKKVVIK